MSVSIPTRFSERVDSPCGVRQPTAELGFEPGFEAHLQQTIDVARARTVAESIEKMNGGLTRVEAVLTPRQRVVRQGRQRHEQRH